MKIIDPEVIDDSVLTVTNVTETVAAYSATAYNVAGDLVRSDTTHHVYEALIGKAAATVTISNATPGVVTHSAHGLANDTAVAFSTTGALPTGLTEHTVYYVRNASTNTYELASAAGGSSIATSSSGSGTHTEHATPNRGRNPDDQAANSGYWLDTGATNRWKMFDGYLESQTEKSDEIACTLKPAGRVDAVAFLNVDAVSIDITITDATEGVVYDESFSLISDVNCGDYYDYCFQPIIRDTQLFVDGLPPYLAPDIDISISYPGGTAKCGSFDFGSLRILGATVYGAGFGIVDYSRKVFDQDFGVTTLVERSYRRTGNFRVVVDKNYVGEVARILTERRAQLSVFSGTDDYSSTLIKGFPKSWDVAIEHLEQSALNIEIEGII